LATPAAAIAQLLGGGLGQVDDPAVDERAAVVDPHLHLAAVVEVGDLDDARQRQRLVGRRRQVHVEDLAVGRAAIVELLAVPRADPALVIVRIGLRIIPDPPDLIGLFGAAQTRVEPGAADPE
jgi:hypothetical protein